MECIIHYEKVDEAAESVVLSASKLAELKYVAKEWVKTGKEPECFIAKNVLTMTMDECCTYKYHRLCMFRFSKSKLERAKESAMKRKNEDGANLPSPKKLRSSEPSTVSLRHSLLPVSYVIRRSTKTARNYRPLELRL